MRTCSGSGAECGRPGTGPGALVAGGEPAGDVLGGGPDDGDAGVDGAGVVTVGEGAVLPAAAVPVPATSLRKNSAAATAAMTTIAATLAPMIAVRRLEDRPPAVAGGRWCRPVSGGG